MKHNVIRFGAFLGLLFSLSFSVHAENPVALEGAKVGEWTMDYDAALKLAGEKNLPLMLNFTGSDWCHWCQHMDKAVFGQEAWKKFAADNLILVTIDFPEDPKRVPENLVERNAKLKAKYSIQGYPTYMVIDSDGQTVLGQLGADQEITPDSFIGEIKSVTRFSKASVEAYCKANPDKAEAFKAELAEMSKAEKEFETWLATNPTQNPENDKKFADFQSRFEKIIAKLDAFK